jgi:hypothetical protein
MMNKKIIIIALLALLLISAAGYVILANGMNVLVACKTGFTITNSKPIYGYQIIKVTCNMPGYNPPLKGLDYFCGETNKCE